MRQNYPLKVFITSLILVSILIIGSQPSIQQSLITFFGLQEVQSASNKLKKVSAKGGEIEYARVNRVIDGDTVILNDGRTIRYLNIDTPETKKPNTPIMCFGKEASEYNKAVVEGKEVILVSEREDQDKYGRSLRFVFPRGRNTDDISQSVNAALVEKGFARASIYRPNDTYEKEFTGYQFEAQKKGLGVWKCPKPFEE